MKKYKVGMYGGMFMPLHKGHNYCIEKASKECEIVYVILFYGCADEQKVFEKHEEEYLSVKSRESRIINIAKQYKNVLPVMIDVSTCRLPNGKEDWDAETPLARNVVGDKLDAVYSSEPSYDDYFHKAYPEAVHRLVDVKRIHFPITGEKIRNMKDLKERELWIV